MSTDKAAYTFFGPIEKFMEDVAKGNATMFKRHSEVHVVLSTRIAPTGTSTRVTMAFLNKTEARERVERLNATWTGDRVVKRQYQLVTLPLQ